jgi:hypothetical protein
MLPESRAAQLLCTDVSPVLFCADNLKIHIAVLVAFHDKMAFHVTALGSTTLLIGKHRHEHNGWLVIVFQNEGASSA